MTSRIWIWGAVVIILAGLLSYWAQQSAKTQAELNNLEAANAAQQDQAMQVYLVKQTDGRKLVSLLKRLPNASSSVRKIIALRAFELNPESRDTALLASTYSTEAAAQLKKIDPLYKE